MNPFMRDVRLQLSGAVILAAWVSFVAARVGIWLTNPVLFAGLPPAEIAAAFLQGMRFDFYIMALFFGPVIFLLNLPFKSRRFVQVVTVVLLAQWVFLTGFLVADFVYFPKVGRHIAEEIIQVANDWGFVVSYALTQLWWALLILLGGLVAVATWLWRRIGRTPQMPRTPLKTGVILGVIACLCVAGIRGHLGRGKSLGVADVYNFVPSAAGAALALNGAFTAYQIGRKGAQEFTNTFPVQEAIANTQTYMVAPAETVLSEQYPLERQHPPVSLPSARPNIFIILLEGWHPYYIDGLSHQGFGATPVFDTLLKNGVNFTNAYAAGQRSIFGFAAVLASLPLIPGLPMFGYGLEMTQLSPMPKHFAQHGYYTFFAQTSHRDSYRLCALASYLGMQDSFGWEDIPQRLPYRQKAPFGYDYDALQFAADQIAKHPHQPFLGMVFTGITHEPFTSTLPQFDKYPYDTWEHGFLNTLAFADWSIGQLLERAKQDGWFDNTIFVLVADHTSGGPAENTLKNHFHIPLVVYGPRYFNAQEQTQVVSQLDIVPTLYEWAGITPAYTAFGRDLFDTSIPRVALVSEGNNVGLITQHGAVRHSGSKLLTVEPYTKDFDAQAAENTLLSFTQAAYMLLKENRWYTAQEGAQ